MARRLMGRRGNSASQPQVTPYQQLELDDGWREWENTKQELVLVKRQLTEKDALILQLKTASRRLQETLRKREKDLQAAFAILRSPQDAKTTKTRKQELVDRLVSECMQRAATSEALAEERRKELDRLKYSSKFLRFQELEVEIEECHTEIDRLRAKLETTATSSPTAIAGKLKISAVPLVTNVSGSTLVKKYKLEPLNLQEQESPDSRQNMSIPRMSSTQSAAGQVRVVPLPKYDHREGFVSKTRRRALEAEYYKQVRLAQLEVECELEENLHIRAAREAKRLEATERQERRTDFITNSARSQQFTPRNNDPGEEDVQSTATANKETKDIDKADEVPEKYESEDPVANAPEKDSGNDGRYDEAMEVQREKKTYEGGENADATDDHCKETDYESVWNVDPNPHNNPEPYQNDDNFKETGPGTIWNMDPISGSNGARDDSSKDSNPGSVWNMDPNPENSYQNESKIADVKDSAQDNDEINMKSAAWNVDPEPPSVEADKEDPDRAIWNADPNPGDPISPLDDVPVVYSDDDDDDPEAEEKQDNSVSSDVNNESTAWNLPISPSLPTEEKYEDSVISHEVEADSVKDDSRDDDDNDQKEVWNVDPTPASHEHHPATSMTDNTDVEHLTEVNQRLWNLNPEPAPVLDAVSSSEEIQHTHDDTNDEISPENAGSAAKEIVHADSSSGEDLNTVAGNPSPMTENTDNPWNLEPKVSTSPGSNTDERQIPDAGELSASTENVQLMAAHTGIDSDPDTNTVWNLTPSAPEPHHDSEGGNEEDNRNSVWNLDPHTGDSSEPPEVIAASELLTEVVRDNEDASTPRSLGDSLTEDPKETPAESPSNYDEGTEAPAESPSNYDEGTEAPAAYPSETSNPSSPSEYEDDATPEYTPPSTARDSDDD